MHLICGARVARKRSLPRVESYPIGRLPAATRAIGGAGSGGRRDTDQFRACGFTIHSSVAVPSFRSTTDGLPLMDGATRPGSVFRRTGIGFSALGPLSGTTRYIDRIISVTDHTRGAFTISLRFIVHHRTIEGVTEELAEKGTMEEGAICTSAVNKTRDTWRVLSRVTRRI